MNQMERLFPNADVQHQPAVDLRNVSTDILLKQNLITHSSAHAIRSGRRWHHEAPSRAALGLQHANRLALREDTTQPLLLLEEDCVIQDEERFSVTMQMLLEHIDTFDIAAFGVFHTAQQHQTPVPYLPDGWVYIDDMFWGLHCALYAPSARSRLSVHLEQPLEMQIDSLYGSMAHVNQLRVIAQTRNWCARQSLHVSTIQDIPATGVTLYVTLCLLCVLCVLCGLRYIMKKDHHEERSSFSRLAPLPPLVLSTSIPA